MTRAVRLFAAAVVLVTPFALGACSTDSTVEPGATAAATIATTTIPITGTPDELLPEMAVEMSRLSSQVAEDGDAENATLARIVGMWAAAAPQVRATAPQLVSSIQTTVEMATSAVERKRPADADKAYNLLTDLVASYDANS